MQLFYVGRFVNMIPSGDEKTVLIVDIRAGIFCDEQQIPYLPFYKCRPYLAFSAPEKTVGAGFVIGLGKQVGRQLLGDLAVREFRNRIAGVKDDHGGIGRTVILPGGCFN